MEVEFLGQPFSREDRLGGILEGLLADADSLLAIVAWAQVSGMGQLQRAIQGLRERGGSAAAVLGIDGEIATRESLELAVELFDPVSVFHDTGSRLFHPKLYCVERPGEIAVAVGSSNLTGGGLFLNYEANVVLRLDPGDPEDRRVHEEVLGFRDALTGEGMPAEPLTFELIARLAEEGGLIAASPRRATTESGVPAGAEGLAQEVFGAPVRGLPTMPRVPQAPRGRNGAAQPAAVPASVAPAELRWWKRLTASDVLRKPPGSHQRNYVALSKAGHDIEWKTWFREELFGTATWSEQTMHTGNVKEVALVPFDVLIEDRGIGRFELRIDHAEARIADQNNAPTYLNWSSMIEVVRERDFRDWWLELARLADGGFRLRLLRKEPAGG